jgi:uncharacterized membrane protein YhhN
MIARRLLSLYVLVGVVDVVAELADATRVATVAQPLLMPLLAAFLLASSGERPRLVRWTAIGLGCAWLGDVAFGLPIGPAFELGLVCFVLMQVCYLTAFKPYLGDSPIRRNRWLVLPYVGWWALLFGALAPDLGGLMIPVAVHGALLVAMAAFATGVNRLTAIGAAVFVVSDSVLAATSLTDRLAFGGSDAVVMATYVVGQALLVLGVLARSRADSEVSVPATSAMR